MLDYGDEHFDDLPKTKYNNEEPLNYDDEDTSRTALNHGDAPDTSNGRIALNYDDDSSNARIALNYDDAPDNSNSRGNLVNYGDVDEVEKDDSESEYEDYEYGKQILPVSSKSNITVPMNGAEYLRTVRDQAKTIPRVVAAEVKKRTFADPDACFGEWRVSLLEMDAFKRPRIESKDEESSIKKEVRNSIESSIKNETDLHSENWPDSALRRFYNIRKGLKRIPYDEVIFILIIR